MIAQNSMLQRFSGVSVRRVIDRSHADIPQHAHDWPVLSLFVMGAYTNHTEIGAEFICDPSAILYRAGAAHHNIVGSDGFEQVEIEFDPAWLRSAAVLNMPVQRWIGRDAGAEARSLAHLCSSAPTERRLHAAVGQFFERRSKCFDGPTTNRIDVISQRLRRNPALKISELAKEVDRHPGWLGEAYRRAIGEGLQETAARLRVERAARLLRETDLSYAIVAADTGFCDQSHMNRTFRRMLGRSPSGVRGDRACLRQL
jgi:AraC-like DNA-binding protein